MTSPSLFSGDSSEYPHDVCYHGEGAAHHLAAPSRPARPRLGRYRSLFELWGGLFQWRIILH